MCRECKKILLEDYTGHKCGNCPRAAEKAEELKEIYGDQLIPIAIHAGFFASDFGGNFTTDFTSIQEMNGMLFLEIVRQVIQMAWSTE